MSGAKGKKLDVKTNSNGCDDEKMKKIRWPKFIAGKMETGWRKAKIGNVREKRFISQKF